MHSGFKILCVLLLMYVAVFAFLTPLSPALLQTDLSEIRPGEHTFTLTGYNTHFAEGDNALYLINDSTMSIPCTIDAVIDNSHLRGRVTLPNEIHSKAFAFVLNNAVDLSPIHLLPFRTPYSFISICYSYL